MKTKNISLLEAFIAKQEDHEEWVDEREISKDEALNVKGLVDLVNDSLDGLCDIDGSHGDTESSPSLVQTWYLDNGSSRHLTDYNFLQKCFTKKDGLIVMFGENNGIVVAGVRTVECRTIILEDVFYV